MPDSKPLTGKVALITGGAKRLGRAAALTLAQSGSDVAITFLRSEKQARQTLRDLEEAGVRALAVHCDVTDPRSVRDVLREVVGELGNIDILVNNAANYETVSFDNLTLPQWDAIFATITQGAWQNYQSGIARRGASVGRPRALLLVQSRPAHVD